MFEFLSDNISRAFSRLSGARILKKQLVSDVLQKVKRALLESDVPLAIATAFCEQVAQECAGKKRKQGLTAEQQLIACTHDRLKQFLGAAPQEGSIEKSLTGTVLFIGLQGAGKTTSIAKIAHYVRSNGAVKGKLKILVGSTDYSRPAAIEQLKQLAQTVGVDFFQPDTTDPVAAAERLAQRKKEGSYDLLLLDSAGRLQIDDALMQQLVQVKQAVRAETTVLVLDAMTGQQSLAVAQSFENAVGFEWALLSKMDSRSSGGAAFSFYYALQKPVAFVGVGERPRDLEPFNPDRVAGQILGMGDIVTLAEKAEKVISERERTSADSLMKTGRFTFDDFAAQTDMMQRMGSLQSLMKYLPKDLIGGVSSEQIDEGIREMTRFRAIINSMTVKERACQVTLIPSRVARIARGAGVSLSAIKMMIQRFEEMQQSAKMFSKMSKNDRSFW